ncbi:MAG: heavy metal-associated domain-containing protein [Balneolales bacterium]
MKKYLYYSAFLIIMFISCNKNDSESDAELIHYSTDQISFNIPALHCDSCVKSATEALKKVEGVDEVKIDLTEKYAVIYSNGDISPDPDQISDVLEKIGLEAVFDNYDL